MCFSYITIVLVTVRDQRRFFICVMEINSEFTYIHIYTFVNPQNKYKNNYHKTQAALETQAANAQLQLQNRLLAAEKETAARLTGVENERDRLLGELERKWQDRVARLHQVGLLFIYLFILLFILVQNIIIFAFSLDSRERALDVLPCV